MKYIKELIWLMILIVLGACQSETQKEETMENAEDKEITFLVGTYIKGEGQGIYVYKFNTRTGETRLVSVNNDVLDPSFLAVSPDKNYVYSTSKHNGGSIFAYSLSDSTLTFINSALSGGENPCYVSLDNTGKYVFAGNYANGSVAVLPVLENGGVGEPIQTIQHKGSGPYKGRQDGPHVHAVKISPDNKQLFVPDLGIDEVVVYRFDSNIGRLSPGKNVKVTPGTGPRHLIFHPNNKFVYLIHELTGHITGYRYADSPLAKIQEVSTLPEGYKGDNSSADIHISSDGKFLYASNRFHDSIVVFSINQEDGKLSLVSHHSAMGAVPRSFAISPDDKFVLVANQESGNIVIFERDKASGKLSPTDREIKLDSPVNIRFVD
jgi:6-phosphogluconolactonase